MYVWINAALPGERDTCNMRVEPVTSADVLGQLNTRGVLTMQIESMNAPDSPIPAWYRYRSWSGGVVGRGWVSESVHKRFVFTDEGVALDVPYRDQRDKTTAKASPNDCGAACLAMMLARRGVDVTIDEITAFMAVGKRFAEPNDLTRAARHFGKVSLTHYRPMHLTDVLRRLQAGREVLCLINYGELKPDNTYGHFVVATGYHLDVSGVPTLKIIIHDPYDDANQSYDADQFAAALGCTDAVGNMPYQAMIIEEPPPDSGGDKLQRVEAVLAGIRYRVDDAFDHMASTALYHVPLYP